MKMLRLVTLLGSLVAPAPDLAGQAVAARAVVALPRSSVSLSGATERVSGVWGGAALDFHAGRFTLSANGMRGHLTPSSAALLGREVGELSVRGRYQIQPWLGFELGYAARAFSSAAGLQRWSLWGASGTVSRELGLPGVRAHAGFAYLPVVNVTEQARRISAWGTDVGISIASEQAPVFFGLEYRLERFSFPQIARRSEQFEALTFSVGVRVRRLNGRWRVAAGDT